VRFAAEPVTVQVYVSADAMDAVSATASTKATVE
jgi:hypothetical protein